MLKNFLNRFKGDRKHFTIVFFILFLVLLSGIIAPFLTDKIKTNWNTELSDEIKNIEDHVFNSYKSKERLLINTKIKLADKLHLILKPGNQSYGSLIKTVNDKEFQGFSVEIFAPNAKMIAWNSLIAVPQEELFPLSYPYGETYFYISSLLTYLTIIDTLHIDSDVFFISVSLPFEKHYEYQNEFYDEISFNKEISERFYTQFNIDYVPYTQKSKDGRKYSFEILNNKFNKIGLVSFFKPSLTNSINNLNDIFSQIQSLLILFAFIFIGLGFKNDTGMIKSRLLRLIIFTIYAAAMRTLLFIVELPSRFIEGPLVDSANFSSTFGWGIVKSPMELFVTSLFLILISIKSFQCLTGYLVDLKTANRKYVFRFLLLFASILMILVIIRGFAASIKSVVFDSALRYFRGAELIPEPAVILMILNILLIGSAVVLLIGPLMAFYFRMFSELKKSKRLTILIATFIVFQIFGLIFITLQKQPLINPLLSLVLITILFLFAYHLAFNYRKSINNFIYAGLAGSIISITLLNYFNLELERESLKTTSFEITRSDDNLVRFLLEESLIESSSNSEIVNSFPRRNTNFDALAFIIWSKSSIQRESLNSSISLFDRYANVIGSFSAGLSPLNKLPAVHGSKSTGETIIYESTIEDENNVKLFTGVVPVTERGLLLGYISASIQYSPAARSVSNIPEFLRSKKNLVNSVIDFNQLNIFQFTDSKLVQAYGEVYPSREQTEPILKAKFNKDNEAWLNLNMNDENYLTYALRIEYESFVNILSVSVQEKHFTWSLFNFFKIFIIQSIFIFVLLVTILVIKIRELKYSFKTQLLTAFLFVSIIPVGLLAVYNREVVQERTKSSIIGELNERTSYIENHINTQLAKKKDRKLYDIFENVTKELNISFAVFDGTNLLYNSQPGYYNAGLFSKKINSQAYYYLNYLSYREYFLKESIDNYDYDSFYKRINIGGSNYFLNVNDGFNKIKVTFSTIDVDVFLFGVYSFAVLMIIIISTIMANRIAAPIRRLTKATDAVANGDLSIQLKGSEKGEIKELFERFNMMTAELLRNQVELAELERENAWKEMAKQVAHEIKNPLTPMKLAVQQLMISYREKKNFEQLFEKVANTILNQIDTLSLIASEFSSFARMPNYKLEKIDLIPIANDAANLFVDEKIKISVVTNLDSLSIEADRSNLRRMFINLIRNSIQADATIINIRISEVDEIVDILFSDDGLGIPENLRNRIFELNFTTKEKGMGIGLKLVKRFLEGIRGSISLENSVTGTLFKITIPSIKTTDRQ